VEEEEQKQQDPKQDQTVMKPKVETVEDWEECQVWQVEVDTTKTIRQEPELEPQSTEQAQPPISDTTVVRRKLPSIPAQVAN